jgi:predicted amidohydrolase
LDLLVVPARWPRVRDDLWSALLRARAIENQIFVIGVNARDDEGGGSYAYAPDGSTVFAIGPDRKPDEAPWQSFEFDLGTIKTVKDRLDTRIDARLL